MSHTSTWITKDSEDRYDNDWITVSHRNVIAPTGKPAIYGHIHFKNLAIGIVPIDADGYTWLVGQDRYPLNTFTWEIPEGGGARSDDPLDTAKRELKEETGITARKWTQLLKLHTSNSVTDEVGYTFVAQQLEFGEDSPDDTEKLTIKRIPLDEAFEMAMDGEITDSLALASLLKVQLLLDRGQLKI